MTMLLLPLALVVASCTASVLPRNPAVANLADKAFVKLPITYRERSQPLRKRDQDVPLFNITSISYLVELSIGNPGQSVKVAIDTGSDELWVNPDCTSQGLSSSQVRECQADGQYDPTTSSTSNELQSSTQIKYGKGAVALQYYTDDIALPESTINVTDAQFGVATASEDLNEGIMGLGWGNGFNLDYNNFIDDLADEGITNSRAFSVALGSVTANNGGVLIFGGVDTKKFTGPLVPNKILGPQGGENLYRYWIQMTSVALSKSGSNTKQYPNANMPIVLDSGSSLSYLPSSIVTQMAQDFQGQFDSSSGLYQVPCAQAQQQGTVDFTFGEATIKVPFNEFIWQFSSQICILGAVPVSGGGMTALLGDTFMRSAFVVFDQTTETISLAQYANCGENEQVIPAGGAGNFTGECMVNSGEKSAGGRTMVNTVGFVVAVVVGLAVAL
ncbi:aspartic peptidase domain-containing protein [Coniochaeta sp. 2T2.1]|nr:aspartic peptidase domain-containing protein [Coniochaeta sp. 2T2.1]